MRGMRMAALAVAAMLMLIPATGSAQEVKSGTKGFMANVHLNGTSVSSDDLESESGAGVGVDLGYGFTQALMIFVSADAARLTADDEFLEGEYGLAHIDVGGRFSFANPARAFVPYVQAGFTGLGVGMEIESEDENNGIDIELQGRGFMVGGGVLYFFSPKFAADLGLKWTSGTFTEGEVDNEPFEFEDDEEVDMTSMRFNLGISWFPMAN